MQQNQERIIIGPRMQQILSLSAKSSAGKLIMSITKLLNLCNLAYYSQYISDNFINVLM